MDLKPSNGTSETQASLHLQSHLTWIRGNIPEHPDHNFKDDGASRHERVHVDKNVAVIFGVVGGIIVLAVIIVLSLQYWRKRKSGFNKEAGKKAAVNRGRGPGKSQSSVPSVSERRQSIARRSVQVKQQEVKNSLCYHLLAQALESFLRPGVAWTFASPIYVCVEHGAQGLFELQFRVWATGKKLLLCHNPLSDQEKPQWEFMMDAHVVMDELAMLYRVTVHSLCHFCVVTYGEFKEKLVLLPFVRPAPHNPRIITITLFFERDPSSNSELDALVQQYLLSMNVGHNAVLCQPTPSIIVRNSKLYVQCNVPENLTNCLQITRLDEQKVLTVEQLKGLHEEHRIGPCLQFVLELNDDPRPGRWPILKLIFQDCEEKAVRTPETVFCPPFPSIDVSHVPLHHDQPHRGTLLSRVVKSVYQCNPGMFYNLWRDITGSPAWPWQYTADDVARIVAHADGMRRTRGEQLLHDLAENHQDVTVERLAAVVQCMGYAPLSDTIRQGTMRAGCQFDDVLYRELVDSETQVALETQVASSLYPYWYDYDRGPNIHLTTCRDETTNERAGTSSIGPVPSSPPQSTILGSLSLPPDLVPGEPPAAMQWHQSERPEELELLPLSPRNNPSLVPLAASCSELSYPSTSASRLNDRLQVQASLGVFTDDESPNNFT